MSVEDRRRVLEMLGIENADAWLGRSFRGASAQKAWAHANAQLTLMQLGLSGSRGVVLVAKSEGEAREHFEALKRAVQWAGLDLMTSRLIPPGKAFFMAPELAREMKLAGRAEWWRTFSEELRRRTHDRLGYCSHSPRVSCNTRAVCDGCGFTMQALVARGEVG